MDIIWETPAQSFLGCGDLEQRLPLLLLAIPLEEFGSFS